MAPPTAPAGLQDLQTPALVVDLDRFDRNVARMRASLAAAGSARLRAHLKTVKSVEAATRMLGGTAGPITVSTLKEAEEFAAAGFGDILYAVGIAPAKLARVIDIRRRHGTDLAVVTDNIEAADAIAAAARRSGEAIPVLIEVDCDGHRAGVCPDDRDLLLEIAGRVASGGAEVRGVMTHAGGSYDTRDRAALEQAAAAERDRTFAAAQILRAGGHEAPVVSIGSTPTALSGVPLPGISEVRAGVFPFFDLVMAGLGVCAVDDIALSVLATVIGHQRSKGWILVDAGWMAMSRDRGTAAQAIDQGYGIVCDASGRAYPDLVMIGANQEHGIIAARPGSGAPPPDLPVGALLRILPNHACATAAQHERYHVAGPDGSLAVWSRFNGW